MPLIFRLHIIITLALYYNLIGYSAISQSTDVGHHVFFDDVTVCNLGRARYVDELALADRFPLSRDFVADACALPATFDPVEYMRFLDTWGTVSIIVISYTCQRNRMARTGFRRRIYPDTV